MNEIIPRTTVTDICAHRDLALRMMRQAVDQMKDASVLAEQAAEVAGRAHGASVFTGMDRAGEDAYRRIFRTIDADESYAVYRKQVDARVWMQLLLLTGMSDLMDRTAKAELEKQLCGDVPEVTEDNVRDVIASLVGDSELIFKRGLARCFSELDRRFKSHDGWKLGSRIILTRVFDEHGHFNYHSKMRDTIADIERVFAILDKQAPDPGALARAIQADRDTIGRWGAKQSTTETAYFRIRCYQNGNAHLWFLRDDLVELANKLLAEYYGAVLADGVTREDSADDLRTVSGLPSKDLAFYPTPDAVVDECLRDIQVAGRRVLEPSAGTGNMVAKLLKAGAVVTAVEIDHGRAHALTRFRFNSQRLTVYDRNFLRMTAMKEFDFVVMNPPFYGTHWMQHVMHAFDFLKPGGTLVAVLPVSAELGETKAHVTFREWAKARSGGYHRMFRDLPAESFASSGTRINTVILTLVSGG